MPLESIVLIGGALLGIVVAAVVGSLLGRRFRGWREQRATADSAAATPSTPAPLPAPPASVTSAERAAAEPVAMGPTVTIVDPLARSALQRTDGDATFRSTASFGRRLWDAPPPVATRTTSSLSPAMRDRAGGAIGGARAAEAMPDAPVDRFTSRGRRRGILAVAVLAGVVALGGIAAAGALRADPDGRVADATGTPGAATAVPPHPSRRPPTFGPGDPRGIAVVGTSPDPGSGLGNGGSDITGGGFDPAGPDPATPAPTSQAGGADPTAAPTAAPSVAPSATPPPTPTPAPTPTRTPDPTPAPAPTPKPPTVDFSWAVDGLTVSFANRSRNAATWVWSFGDGTTSSVRNPIHTYDSADTWTVTLTATSTTGITASHSEHVTTGN